MQRVEDGLKPLVDSGEIANIFSISGQGGSVNSGFMVLTLAPWGERERTPAADRPPISTKMTAQDPGDPRLRRSSRTASASAAPAAGCRWRWSATTTSKLGDAAAKLVRQMEDSGRFENVAPELRGDPGAAVGDDRPRAGLRSRHRHQRACRRRCRRCSTAAAWSTSIVDGEAYPVSCCRRRNPVNDPTDLENIFLKTGDGKIVPMSIIATVEERAGRAAARRENSSSRSVALTAGLRSGMCARRRR